MKQRRHDRSFIVILILLAIVVVIIAASFLRKYLAQSPEPVHIVNSFVVTPESRTQPERSNAEALEAEMETTTTTTTSENLETVEVRRGLEINSLIELFVQAVNKPDEHERIFREIPASQRGELAYEEFVQYMNLLSRGVNGHIDAYSTMSLEYVRAIQADMYSHGETASHYVDASTFHWLEHNNLGETYRFPLLIQVDVNGTPYLSREYIRSCLDLYSFTRLYYQVLEKGDVAALSELIYSDSRDGQLKRQKSEVTLDYYKSHIAGSFEDYRLISVRSDSLILEQKLRTSPARESSDSSASDGVNDPTTRRVTVVRQDKDFLVYDAIPDEDLVTPRVMMTRHVLYHLNDFYTFDQVISYQGQPDQIRAWTLPEAQDGMTTAVEVIWKDKTFRFISDDFDPESLEGRGRLISVQSRDPSLTLNQDIEIGMQVETLLKRFLFLNVQNYSWVDRDQNSYQLYFEAETETIGEIAQASPVWPAISGSLKDEIPVNAYLDAMNVRRDRRIVAEQRQEAVSEWASVIGQVPPFFTESTTPETETADTP